VSPLEPAPVKQLKYWQAINEGLREEFERDPSACLIGEDVGGPGGPFGATQGLLEAFGPDRVRDAPISEAALTGLATGAAMVGLRPVLEIMFFDFILLALDQLVNHAAKMRFMSGGSYRVPLTIITACGARRGTGPQHSQVFDAVLAGVPGLRLVWPSTPADAKGLLKSAIRCDDPVVFVESLSLWRTVGEVPENDALVPLGRAAVSRPGEDVTIVGIGSSMPAILGAAEELGQVDISCEVVDLRSLSPLDVDTVAESARRTGRLVVVQDSSPNLGVGVALVGHLAGPLFGELKSAPQIVAPPGSPTPFSPVLEAIYYPSADSVVAAVKATLG
jgi:pyruvate/2-oxoglutarate/acetoin dehydrogenase E1 component